MRAPIAAGLVGAISLGNMIGRFGWSWLSDGIGRRAVFVAIFLLEAAALFMLPAAGDAITFTALAFLVALCFGGRLGAMPAFTADYFGSKHVGAIFGLLLAGSGPGSVLRPLLLATSVEATGGYGSALWLLGGLALGGAAIPLLLRPPAQRRVLSPATS